MSHPSTDVARDKTYYETVFAADVLRAPTPDMPPPAETDAPTVDNDGNDASGGVMLLALDFNSTSPGAYVQVHLVQRMPSNTTGTFAVSDWEDAMNECHRQTYASPVCGWDSHNDNHFALSQPTRTAQEYVDGFDAMAAASDGALGLYHMFNDAAGNISFYAISPTGFTVQIAAPPLGGYDPAPLVPGGPAGDLCGQGNCFSEREEHLEERSGRW